MKESIVDILLSGTLPIFLKNFVQGSHEHSLMNCIFVRFDDIEWDYELLDDIGSINVKNGIIKGVRLNGNSVVPETVTFDNTFEQCPLARKAGIPLFVKKTNMISTEKSKNLLSPIMFDPFAIDFDSILYKISSCTTDVVNFVAYLLIGLTLRYVFAFVYHLKIVGLWLGMVGAFCSAASIGLTILKWHNLERIINDSATQVVVTSNPNYRRMQYNFSCIT
ncbi:hypothetical protein THRCLA_22448 [Thraustotheca clavata]|uniref:Transmembrane protein n=1 Tax=Thraustotheca clavata TaxID=74557 RepID=A0A1V9Z106_9STRA|nr:hypothetical protein THRCLA_22448 [Thraustotheca clavata]